MFLYFSWILLGVQVSLVSLVILSQKSFSAYFLGFSFMTAMQHVASWIIPWSLRWICMKHAEGGQFGPAFGHVTNSFWPETAEKLKHFYSDLRQEGYKTLGDLKM